MMMHRRPTDDHGECSPWSRNDYPQSYCRSIKRSLVLDRELFSCLALLQSELSLWSSLVHPRSLLLLQQRHILHCRSTHDRQ